jgi:hypothetical protein
MTSLRRRRASRHARLRCYSCPSPSSTVLPSASPRLSTTCCPCTPLAGVRPTTTAVLDHPRCSFSWAPFKFRAPPARSLSGSTSTMPGASSSTSGSAPPRVRACSHRRRPRRPTPPPASSPTPSGHSTFSNALYRLPGEQLLLPVFCSFPFPLAIFSTGADPRSLLVLNPPWRPALHRSVFVHATPSPAPTAWQRLHAAIPPCPRPPRWLQPNSARSLYICSTDRLQFRQANFRLATNINPSCIFSSDPFHWCSGSSPLPRSSRS